MLAGLLMEGDEPAEVAEAAEVLERTARHSPDVFDAYDVLATALRRSDPAGWAARFAAAAAAASSPPAALPGVLAGLAEPQRTELSAALAQAGISDASLPGATAWSRVEPRLRTLSRAEIAGLAAGAEAKDPALALKMWEYVDHRTDSALGRARCLVALDRASAAAAALTGVSPAQLQPHDVLFVATLAAQVGDLPLAGRLLDGLPPGLDGDLAATAAQLRGALLAATGTGVPA